VYITANVPKHVTEVHKRRGRTASQVRWLDCRARKMVMCTLW